MYHTAIGGEKRGINAEVQGLLAKSSQAKCNSSVATAPVFVIVNGARNRKAPMFPNVSIFEWVLIVEYELLITR